MEAPVPKRGFDQAWLVASPLPIPLNLISVHTWCVVSDRNNKTDRWEVWHRKLPIQNRWGYIHCNLFAPFQGIGINPIYTSCCWDSVLLNYWEGDAACRLAIILSNSVRKYPLRGRYRYWPGPNSNTYIQWIFDQFQGEAIQLPKKALGASFMVT